ncbi:MAG: hypothetical protein PVI57_20245 [Gemmatimonadota bacterium]
MTSSAEGSTPGADPRSTDVGTTLSEIDPRGGLPLLDALTVLAGWSRRIALTGIAFAVLAMGLSLLLSPRGYVAHSSFFSQATGSPQPGRLTGLAQQFGLNVGGAPSTESLAFYSELLTSPTLLGEAVASPYRLGSGADERVTTYVDVVDPEAQGEEGRRRAAIRHLRDHVTVRQNDQAGLLELDVLADDADLAVQVNRRMLDLVNEFNVTRRQSQMRAEREFVEQRLEEYRRSLEDAERDLEEFIDNNRSYQNAPHLATQAARLERRVQLQQQMFTSLSQSYEEARIEEVRNTPVITVVEPPGDWVGRRGPSLLRSGFLGLVFGLVVGVVWAFLAQYWSREVEGNPAAYERLRAVVRARTRF